MVVRAASWFALGCFASMAGGLCIEGMGNTTPSRTNNEEALGVFLGLAAPLSAAIMGVICGGWLAWRGQSRGWRAYGFAVPLLLGMLWPLTAGGWVAAVLAIGPIRRSEALGSTVCAFGVLGSPVALAEVAIRFGGLSRR